MGPKGMVAGAAVGGGLGLVAGGLSLGLLKMTGTTMEEVRYWQYKWKNERTNAYKEGFHMQLEGTDLSFKHKMLEEHDQKVGTTKVNLADFDKETEVSKEQPELKDPKIEVKEAK